MNPESETSIFAEVDQLLAAGNADAAGKALHGVQATIKELFTVPAMTRYLEIDALRGNWEAVMSGCAQLANLAADSPHRGRIATLQAQALRTLGKPDEAEKVVETAAQDLCGMAMKLGEASDFNQAKNLLNVAMSLHPAIELFAKANPLCCQILFRPDKN